MTERRSDERLATGQMIRGLHEDFDEVKALSGDISDQARTFRDLARRLAGLVDAVR